MLGSTHARFLERGDLILHQGDERRDDHAGAFPKERRDLVAE